MPYWKKQINRKRRNVYGAAAALLVAFLVAAEGCLYLLAAGDGGPVERDWILMAALPICLGAVAAIGFVAAHLLGASNHRLAFSRLTPEQLAQWDAELRGGAAAFVGVHPDLLWRQEIQLHDQGGLFWKRQAGPGQAEIRRNGFGNFRHKSDLSQLLHYSAYDAKAVPV